MAHNPVQVILGAEQYMRRPDVAGGGGTKDFYAGNDADFVRHKERLLREVSTVQTRMRASGASLAYVKVKLQSAALAKSHRPIDVVFNSKQFPLVATGALGELYFEVTPTALEQTAQGIRKAEEEVTKRNRKGELTASSARSEVGAIEAIALPTETDKRAFSADNAVYQFAHHPSARYIVIELFVDESSFGEAQPNARRDARAALSNFRAKLKGIARGLDVWSSGEKWRSVKLTAVSFSDALAESTRLPGVVEEVLRFLDLSPIVRQVTLGPVVRHAATARPRPAPAAARATLPEPDRDTVYPIVGIVDGGVSAYPPLAAWSAGSTNFMNLENDAREHGTFIAGLLVNAEGLNPGQPIEPGPCRYFDFDLYSDNEDLFRGNYPKGFMSMMEQLDEELRTNKPERLRVINMSLTPERLADPNDYGWTAAMLDELAERHDVIFVISAGNLEGQAVRGRWPDDATRALQMIAAYPYQGEDRFYEPGESARNLTVGAVELFDDGTTRPARYTRRGPATSAGIKPDFAHLGGCLASNRPLVSLTPDGDTRSWQGTSFSAPLVARTLAQLDHRIEGPQPREVLLALMYHFAQVPHLLNHQTLSEVAKDFAGFGVPATTAQMIGTGDDAITMIFADSLPAQQELAFDFAWPAELVKGGKSRGSVTLTIVSSPPLQSEHKSEFARINLDAYLRQEIVDDETGEISYKGRLKQEHAGHFERSLIEHGAKWWPVKHYRRNMRLGVTGSNQWRLVVDSLTRSGVVYPDHGVRFAVVLSIADPEGRRPVFASMRRSLINAGVAVQDIRTAARARAR